MLAKKEMAQTACALFLDIENLGLHGDWETALDALLHHLAAYGPLIIRRAYADWERQAALRQHMALRQIETPHLPHPSGGPKNGVDIRITVEAMEVLHTLPLVQTFIIGSGDSDFLPLIGRLRAAHRRVVGVGSAQNSSQSLAQTCDLFHFWEDLLSRRSGPVADLAKGSVPFRVGAENMRTLLRKQNLLPPRPAERKIILQAIAQLSADAAARATLKEFQNRLVDLCKGTHKLSIHAVHNCLHGLIAGGFLIEPTDLPLLARPVTRLGDMETMEAGIVKLHTQRLVQAGALVDDVTALSQVLFDDGNQAARAAQILSEVRSTSNTAC